jgi:glycosyltransferase involved in cell wall biosynthesis
VDRDKSAAPARHILDAYRDKVTNILFVGRVAPNKKQSDLIEAFYYYKKHFNKRSRLFIVGADHGNFVKYSDQLKDYCRHLKLKDVIFTGMVSDSELAAYYELADVYVSMSEHEGFGVPLAEAMCHKVPVIAFDCCAVGETVGDAGVLLKDKDPVFVAAMIDRVCRDDALRGELIAKGIERIRAFSYPAVRDAIVDFFNEIAGRN